MNTKKIKTLSIILAILLIVAAEYYDKAERGTK